MEADASNNHLGGSAFLAVSGNRCQSLPYIPHTPSRTKADELAMIEASLNPLVAEMLAATTDLSYGEYGTWQEGL